MSNKGCYAMMSVMMVFLWWRLHDDVDVTYPLLSCSMWSVCGDRTESTNGTNPKGLYRMTLMHFEVGSQFFSWSFLSIHLILTKRWVVKVIFKRFLFVIVKALIEPKLDVNWVVGLKSSVSLHGFVNFNFIQFNVKAGRRI